MSAPLSDDETKHYTAIIDAILSTADLETVTRKKVRQGLEKALGGKDLSDQKTAIKNLIEARFDAINTQASGAMPTPPSAPPTSEDHARSSPKREHSEVNGHTEDDDEEDDASGEIQVSLSQEPVKKKLKRGPLPVDEDARLAAKLQAQELQLSRGPRHTRRQLREAEQAQEEDSEEEARTKIHGEDDSDIEGSEVSATKEKRKAAGGFQKPFNLGYALAELCGEAQLSRPQVVKKLWDHIKANDLQDPSDRRQIRCDEKMQAVFKQSTVSMFSMNKLLGSHLYPIEEE